MKYTIIIFFLLLACKEEDPAPQQQVTDKGCQSGKTSKGDWVFLRCATYEQFQAGSNVSQGGISNFGNYTDHKWEKCSQCQ